MARVKLIIITLLCAVILTGCASGFYINGEKYPLKIDYDLSVLITANAYDTLYNMVYLPVLYEGSTVYIDGTIIRPDGEEDLYCFIYNSSKTSAIGIRLEFMENALEPIEGTDTIITGTVASIDRDGYLVGYLKDAISWVPSDK